jgi:hypothetical protein
MITGDYEDSRDKLEDVFTHVSSGTKLIIRKVAD